MRAHPNGRGAIAGCLVAAVIAVSLIGPSGASGDPTVPWGFNEDWGWSDGAFSATTAQQHMQLAGEIMPDALSANRFHLQWADVEPTRGTYDWTKTDAVYAAMQQSTPDPIMLLFNAPVWARDPSATCPSGGGCGFPPLATYDADWQAFVRAAITRYPDVRAVEVWNEPNLAIFWAPAADPSRYSVLLQEAHAAVAAAGSDAPVLTGGLIPATTGNGNMAAKDFLSQVYADAGATAFEGIGAHPYPHQAPYVDTMWKRLNGLEAVRDANDDGATPLWITEVGLSTDPAAGVPPDQQGDLLAQLYHSVEGTGIASFVIHRLHDTAPDGYWNLYGVMHENLTPKPAYCQLGAAIGTPCPDATPPPAGSTSAPPLAVPPPAAGGVEAARASAIRKCRKRFKKGTAKRRRCIARAKAAL